MSSSLLLFLLGIVCILIFLAFWPELDFVHYWKRTRRLTERVLIEDALKHIQVSDFEHHPSTLHSISGSLRLSPHLISDLLNKMSELDLILIKGDEIHLTPKGYEYALQIIRAHRLWEQYLAQETGYSDKEWHRRANEKEHLLSREDVEILSSKLGNPRFDPHGDTIPSASHYIEQKSKPLTAMSVNQYYRITHIEDEPEPIYAQLIAEGLKVGMIIFLTEVVPQRICFWSGGTEYVLAPIVASNLSVIPVLEIPVEDAAPKMNLADLPLGKKARITNLSSNFRAVERRRLFDLGFIPGTLIEAEMQSTNGDPTAYRIRGSLIALRQDQAKLIDIQALEASADELAHN